VVEETVHLIFLHEGGEALWGFGVAHKACRVDQHPPLPQEKLEEGTQRSEGAIDGVGGIAALTHPRHPSAHEGRVDLFPREAGAKGREHIGTVGERDAIGVAGAGRATALILHVQEEIVNPGLERRHGRVSVEKKTSPPAEEDDAMAEQKDDELVLVAMECLNIDGVFHGKALAYAGLVELLTTTELLVHTGLFELSLELFEGAFNVFAFLNGYYNHCN